MNTFSHSRMNLQKQFKFYLLNQLILLDFPRVGKIDLALFFGDKGPSVRDTTLLLHWHDLVLLLLDNNTI